MTSTQDQGFSIVTADSTDAPRMHAIAYAAFASDTHTLMKVHEKGTAGVESELQPIEEIASYTTRPAKCTTLKAVTPAGEILGWVCWGLWHYDGSHPAVGRALCPTCACADIALPAARGRGESARARSRAVAGEARRGRAAGRAHVV
jgi:hypothetical protein